MNFSEREHDERLWATFVPEIETSQCNRRSFGQRAVLQNEGIRLKKLVSFATVACISGRVFEAAELGRESQSCLYTAARATASCSMRQFTLETAPRSDDDDAT